MAQGPKLYTKSSFWINIVQYMGICIINDDTYYKNKWLLYSSKKKWYSIELCVCVYNIYILVAANQNHAFFLNLFCTKQNEILSLYPGIFFILSSIW